MTDSVETYRKCAERLLRSPDDATDLVNMFSVLTEDGEPAFGKHYIYLAQRAYSLAPNDINAVFNYAAGLGRVGEFKKSLEMFHRALEIAPQDWKARCLYSLGISYRQLGLNRDAIAWYDRALEIEDKPSIRKDRALAMMASGDLQAGLEAFEARRELADLVAKTTAYGLATQRHLPAGVVHWKGEDLKGKTVVVYHEEGSGDFIQFCRYIPRLKEFGAAKIYLTGPVDNLLDLVASNMPVDGIVPLKGPFESDYVIGSMSLPWRVGVGKISGKPYFKSERADIPMRSELNVGLVWKGNPKYSRDAHRSMAFTDFAPLFDIPGVAFYSLQADGAGTEVSRFGFDGFVADLSAYETSWINTARVVQSLDAIVSVDTAIAHLAGALGKPVFILTTFACDWRWNRNSEKTHWYDSARVFRQRRQDDWGPCIEDVRSSLKETLIERRSKAA